MNKIFTLILNFYIIFNTNQDVNSLGIINSILYPNNNIPKENSIKGSIYLYGQWYNSTCKCHNKVKSNHLETCNPKELKVTQNNDVDNSDFSKKDINTFIGDVKDIEWNEISKSYFSCMDGRIKNKTQSTAGGDIGEFILGLHIYETYFSKIKRLTYKQIKLFLKIYLKNMTHDYFYMCTDENSINHLEKELGITGINLKNPRKSLKSDLLNSLTEYHNNGSQHLKMLLNFNEKYSISKKLVKDTIKAFYSLYWNDKELKKKMKLEILRGFNNESSILQINTNNICIKKNLSPVFSHKYKDNQILLININSILIRRAEITYFFINNVNHHSDPIQSKTFFNRMNKIGREFLEITIRNIAKNVPLYTVDIL